MAKLSLVKATTNHIAYIFIQDSSSTTGAGLTGLVFDSSGLTCYYVRPRAAAVQLILATVTVTGLHTDGGFVEVSAANQPGVYRLDFSDAILATGVDSVLVQLKGATNMAPLNLEIQLTDFDLNTPIAQIVDDIWNEILTGATHNVAGSAGRRLRDLQEFGIYDDGAVWIDTVNGSAGTTNFESGTILNPVNTMADANTLAAALGLSRFRIASGSTITLSASQTNQVFIGENWTLALGGQNINNTVFIGATVSGTATNTTGVQYFIDGTMNACTLPADTHVIGSAISGTQTLGEVGDYFYDNCHSGIAGISTPVFDFGAIIGNSNLNVRHYSGGIQIDNKDATGTDQMSLEGIGQLIVSASSSGAISIRGNFQVTNTGGAAITFDDNTQGIADIEVDTDTTIPALIAALNDLSAAQVNAECDTAIADAALATAANLAVVDTIIDAILVDTDTTIPALIAALNNLSAAQVNAECDTALTDYDGPTEAEMNARIPLVGGRVDSNFGSIGGDAAALLNFLASTQVIVRGTVDTVVNGHTPTITEFQADDITAGDPDHYNGRIVIFKGGGLGFQATDITDFVLVGGIAQFTVNAMTRAPLDNEEFVIL